MPAEKNIMKLKSLIWTLGWKSKPQVFGTKVVRFHLEEDGEVEYAKWQHPKDYFHPFAQNLVTQMRRYVKPGDTVLDIGAHTGDYSVPLALAAGAKGCVFAFEPNPYVFRVLEENAKLNRTKANLVPINAAVSDKNEQTEFCYSDPGFCNGGRFEGVSRWKHGHAYKLSVQCMRAQEYLKQNFPERMQNVSLIKIDTEGHELSVIESLQDLIRTNRPYIHAEMFRHLKEQQRQALVETLQSLRYNVHYADGHYSWEQGKELDRANTMFERHYDVVAIPQEKANKTLRTAA
jgi:FkbM family methyltransferase